MHLIRKLKKRYCLAVLALVCLNAALSARAADHSEGGRSEANHEKDSDLRCNSTD